MNLTTRKSHEGIKKHLFTELTRNLLLLTLSAGLAACNSDGNTPVTQGACTPVRAQAIRARASMLNMAFTAPSSIPRVVRSFADKGALSRTRELPVTIALKLNHEDELDQRILEVYEPGSANYHKFLTPAEFRARYAPTQAQIDQAENFLAAHGLHHLKANADGYLISARGTAAALGDAFQTQLRQYQDAQGVTYFAPSSEPRMPQGLSIRAVHGLHNVTRLRSFARIRSASSAAAQFGAPPYGLGPSEIRSAYRIPSSVSGSGQTLALVELDGYNPSDISAYESQYGLPSVPLQNVLVDGASGIPGQESGEVTLDIELMTAVAPGASRIVVYESGNSDQDVLDLYSRIANDDVAQVVSTSWGAPEGTMSTSFLQTENAILKQMAVQGQSVFAASGDAGAYADRSNLGVIDPASQPFVVAVGGTHLNTSRGAYFSETTWNNGSPTMGAGGGGVSILWAQPSWQNGVVTSQSRASTQMRNIPDVSLNADPNSGYAIYLQGNWTTIGGTSAAAPIWAAFAALVNQQRGYNGLPPLGFLNPRLYSIGRSSRYSTDFHDISDGSDNLYYPAVPGFDDATGWGTLDGQNLFEDLSTDPTSTSAALSC